MHWRALAGALMAQDKYTEAEDAYSRAVDIDPEDSDAWLNLSEALLAQGKGAEAEKAARRVTT